MGDVLKIIALFIGFIILMLLLDAGGIFWESKIGVWRQDVKREIFEESKSYTHGKIQDLSKYYREWTTKPDDRESIESLIRMQFADFDEQNIRNLQLREFLIKVRGF